VQEEEDNLIENDIQSFSLEDIILEEDIEKIFPAIEQPENMAHKYSSLEIIVNETFSEENPSLSKVFFLIKNLKS